MKKATFLMILLITSLGFSQTPNPNTPTNADADVVSVYGDTYTSIATNYDPNWGQSGHTQVNTTFNPGDGSALLAYPNFNYQGTEITAGNISAMEFLHVEIWTAADPANTDIQISPINRGSGAGETLVSIAYTSGTWTSIDIPKSSFTNMTWDDVFQMKFAANGAGSIVPVDIYLDNIYFWKTPIVVGSDATLSDLTVDATTVSGFSASTLTYDIELPYGTTTVPTVVGTPTQATPAAAVTTDAGSLPGTSTVEVTSQDGNVTQIYTLNFTVAGLPIGLPLDFSDPSHLFTFDTSGGDPGTVSIINEELSAPTNGQPWDNIFITFTEQVNLTNDAANTITFKIKSTTGLAGVEHFHRTKISGPSGVYELDFSTIGQEEKIVILDYPTLGDNYTEFRIFLDAGYGATASAVETYLIDDISAPTVNPPTCSDGIMNQDETGIDCGGICGNVCDVTAPDGFNATTGTIGSFSVELLLNATDAESDITYDVTYDGGGTAQTIGASGVETPLVISGLTSETMYTFMVSASDASGNAAVNNAITVMATTGIDTSNACAGFSSEASEGTFTIGYNYSFVTEASGTDVTVTFEILDTDKTGLVGEVFIAPSTFIGMTNNGSNSFSVTLTGETAGADITFSGRFPYAGGLARTKDFTYTVGNDCTGPVNDNCSEATLISLGVETAFDNSGSTDSDADSCFTGVVSDIWYSFVAPTSGEVTITVGGSTQYALFSDCSTQVSCNTSANTGLIDGNTYYVAVTDDGTTARIPGASTIQVDDTTSLSNEEFSTFNFSVFPNPTANNWNVKSNSIIRSITVYDILGKQVWTLNPNVENAVIDATTLNSGLYFAKLHSDFGTKTLKLVKE